MTELRGLEDAIVTVQHKLTRTGAALQGRGFNETVRPVVDALGSVLVAAGVPAEAAQEIAKGEGYNAEMYSDGQEVASPTTILNRFFDLIDDVVEDLA